MARARCSVAGSFDCRRDWGGSRAAGRRLMRPRAAGRTRPPAVRRVFRPTTHRRCAERQLNRKLRIGIATWTRRLAGGVESYLGALVPALIEHGHEVSLFHEVDEPSDRAPITTTVPHWWAV